MKRQIKLGLGMLLLAGCNRHNLPGTAPDIRVEVAFSARADSLFCTALDDDPKTAQVVKVLDFDGTFNGDIENPANLLAFADKAVFTDLSSTPDTCLRFTILNKAGQPFVNNDLAQSSCSIRSDAVGEEPIAFFLKTVSEDDSVVPPIKDTDTIAMRLDVFPKNGGQKPAQSGFIAPFTVAEDEAAADAIDRTATLFRDDRLSCIVPTDFRNDQVVGAAAVKDRTSLLTARAFHSATAVGEQANDELEGVIVAGGALSLFGTPQATPQITDSIEILSRASMRFVDGGALSTPRAFHEAVALPGQNGALQVVLIGGTTRSQGIGFESQPFAGAQSPFPIMPFFTPAGTGYDDEAGSGAEVITLNTNTLTVKTSLPVVGAPGRFGAAAARAGEQILYFGGVATTAGQTCGALTTATGTINNFFCDSAIVLSRDPAQADGLLASAPFTMQAARIGASAVTVDDTHILVVGGNAVGNSFAELVTVDPTGVTAPVFTNLTIANLGNTELLRRAFFGLSPIPGAANQFAMFGGERLQTPDANGRIVAFADGFGTRNFAAVLTLDVATNTLTVTTATGASIDSPLTRPAQDAFPELLEKLGVFFGLAQSDARDEDIDAAAIGGCGNATLDCVFSNEGERFVFPVALPGGANQTFLFGGARGPTFPQDAILSLDATSSTVSEVTNGAESLHLYRRVVGLKGALLPGRGGANLIVLTGGLSSFAVPVGAAATVVSQFIADGVRRDVSYFSFGNPSTVADIDDACSFAADAPIFTESALCGFANRSLKQ